ncbi:MAG: hypothetical protein K8I27_15625, partial [Planctomycetes bacterium]|nr:hypothetical protein [Planctomycetota bacterium]
MRKRVFIWFLLLFPLIGGIFAAELDARFGDTAEEFRAYRRTIGQVMKLDANGMPTVLYYFGDTLETSEAVDVDTDTVYSVNERGDLVAPIATVAEVGRLDITVENDGEEVVLDSRIMERRKVGTNAPEQIFAIDASGAINVYYYLSPKTLPNGVQVRGTAIVGYVSEASRPIYYFDADYNLLTRDGVRVTAANRGNVVGFAVQRSDLSVQLPPELAYLADRIVVTEEQGYTRLIQTTDQAADLMERLLAKETNLNATLRADIEARISRVRSGEFVDVRAVIDNLFEQRAVPEALLGKITSGQFTTLPELIAYMQRLDASEDGFVNTTFRQLLESGAFGTTPEEIRAAVEAENTRISNVIGRLKDQEFVTGYLFDRFTNKSIAQINELPDSGFLVEFDIPVNNNESRLSTYRATFVDGQYNIQPESLYLQATAIKGLPLQGLNDLLAQRLASVTDPNRRATIQAAFDTQIAKIQQEFRITNPTIVRTEVTRPHGPNSIDFRIEGDPLARVIASVLSTTEPSVIFNVDFDGKQPTQGYEFTSFNHVYEVVTTGRISRDDYFAQMRERGMSEATIANLRASNVGVFDIDELIRIEKRLLVFNHTAGVENPTSTILVRYIGANDPLSRDFIIEEKSQVRFTRFDTTVMVDGHSVSVPTAVPSGEVAFVPEKDLLVRETQFRSSVSGKAQEFEVVREYRDGQYLGQRIVITYDYDRDIVSEHYVDEGYKIYTRYRIPLYVTRVVGDQEFLYSHFDTRVHVIDGKTYIYSQEIYDTDTPTYGRTNRLFSDNKLIAAEVITDRVAVPGLRNVIADWLRFSRFVHTDAYDNPVSEKFYNTIWHDIYEYVVNGSTGELPPSHIMSIMANQENGTAFDMTNVVVRLNGGGEYTIDNAPQYFSFWVWLRQVAFLALPLLFVAGMGIVAFLTSLSFKRKRAKNINFNNLRKTTRLLRGNKELARKVLKTQILRGPIIVQKNYDGDDEGERKEFVRAQLQGYG